jgi:hypothetical protein
MMQYFVLYENEIGNIYDTYYLAIFENISTLFKPKYLFDEKQDLS